MCCRPPAGSQLAQGWGDLRAGVVGGRFPFPLETSAQDPDVQLCTQRVAKAPGAVSAGGEEPCAVFKVDVAVSKETGKSPDAAIRWARKIRSRCTSPASRLLGGNEKTAHDKYGPCMFPWLMVGKIPMRPAGRK